MTRFSFSRLVLLNTVFLGLGLLVLELIFGGWLFADNKLDLLGVPRNQSLILEHDYYDVSSIAGKNSTAYNRDSYGIRGPAVFNRPELIDILTVGGSTTDQLYIDDSMTWQQQLERLLHASNMPFNIANAGINGQSTHGHIQSFKHWFPQIPNLKPKYVLFYIGINDYFSPSPNTFDTKSKPDKAQNRPLGATVKEKSAIFNLWRKANGFVIGVRSNLTHRKVRFSDFDYPHRQRQVAHREQEYIKKNIEPFRQRVEHLLRLSNDLGATPIFVTQPTAFFWIRNGEVHGVEPTAFASQSKFNGVDYHHHLNLLNEVIREMSQNKFLMIELTNLETWNEQDFYDWVHMTPQGAEKVAQLIFEQLKEHL